MIAIPPLLFAALFIRRASFPFFFLCAYFRGFREADSVSALRLPSLEDLTWLLSFTGSSSASDGPHSLSRSVAVAVASHLSCMGESFAAMGRKYMGEGAAENSNVPLVG